MMHWILLVLGWIVIISLLLVGIRQFLYFYIRRNWRSVDRRKENPVNDKIVLITGANTGIGKVTAQEMADRGATVILACRNILSGAKAVVDIRQKTKRGNLVVMKLNLASLASVRKFSSNFKKRFNKLHILINNAGILTPMRHKLKSEDGFEIHFATNHLGHFLLTNLLLEPIKAAAPSRVVTLTSHIHSKGEIDFDDLMSERKNYRDKLKTLEFPLYSNSKLANVLFNKELGNRLVDSGVQSYALCPGNVRTEISRTMDLPSIAPIFMRVFGFIHKTPLEGAQTVLYCALSTDAVVKNKTGELYQNCAYWEPTDRIQLNDKDAKKLWEISAKLVGLT